MVAARSCPGRDAGADRRLRRRGVGDMCVCVGPPDVIVLGSFKGADQGQPAAYLGSMTAHGGSVIIGCPTVIVS
jgi:uncharacterized Zn-binding protein involved in type VI secretion